MMKIWDYVFRMDITHGGPLALEAYSYDWSLWCWLWEYRKMGCVWNVYGNNDRWMLFYTSNIMRLFICVSKGKDDTESKETGLLVWSKCGYCLWGVAVLIFYVIGIVQIAAPGLVVDGNGCPLIF